MKYACPLLYKRHHYLMLQHGATFDFDDYTPHITLSYDIGDFKATKLPDFTDSIEITEEYHEDLNDNWAKEA